MEKIKRLRSSFLFLALVYLMLLQSCSRYTVTTSQHDPVDIYYKKKTAASFFWGLINNPKHVMDTACGTAGLSEVKFTNHIGYSLLHLVTLGMVNLVKIEWKCQKEAPVVGFQP